jgi:hypothetical protein
MLVRLEHRIARYVICGTVGSAVTRSRIFKLTWLVTAAFCVALATDALPWLRGDVPWIPPNGRWRWPYGHPRWLWLVPCVLGVAIYVIGARRFIAKERQTDSTSYPVRLILWAFVGAALLPLLLLTLEDRPIFLLFTRSASTVTGGYQYATAMSTDLRDTLRYWPQFIVDMRAKTHSEPPGGVMLSPPGLLALYEGDEQLLKAIPPAAVQLGSIVRPLQCQNLAMMTWSDPVMASAWWQMAMPLWAALAVAPLYCLGTLLFDRERAQLAVVLWPLVPGLAIFTPRFNVFFPLLALVMLLELWRGLLRDRPRWIAASGFVLSVALLFNLSLMPLGLLAGLTILGYRLLARPANFRLAMRDLALFGIGCASTWALYWALSGVSPLTVADTILNAHYEMYRPYLPWLFMHPYDMAIFVGLPVAAFALWRIVRLRDLRRRGPAILPADLFAGAAALTLILVVLSGTARGETGRVWLFFAPVWLLLAADMLAGFGTRERLGFLAIQALCLLTMAAVLRANFTAFTEPPRPAEAQGGPTFPVEAHFARGDDRATFAGLGVDAAPTAVTLHLYWRADTRIKRPYVLSLVSVPPDGSSRESLNWNPEGWNYPPSCWTPGREFVDTLTVPLGDTPVPGDWLFSLSILDAFTREPMQVTLPDGTVSTQVGIGPVHVPTPE